MKLIAHRGNINGPNKSLENSPVHILTALDKSFDVEIDVWFVNNKWYLGHDTPLYEVESTFLLNDKLWCHAKNLDALYEMSKLHVRNYFWHETDKFTLTSSGYIWTYPDNITVSNSILVITDDSTNINDSIFGVCSDYVVKFNANSSLK